MNLDKIKENSREIFKIRYSLETDFTQRDLEKIEKKINKNFNAIIKNETSKIRFRTLDNIEELLDNLQIKLDQDLVKLKTKNRLAYNLFIQEKRKQVKNVSSSVDNFLIQQKEKMIELEKDPNKRKFDFLILTTLNTLHNSHNDLYKSLVKEGIKRTSELSKIIRIFSGIFLVFLRIIDLYNHWNKYDVIHKNNIQLEELLLMDLDTLDNLIQSIKIDKKRKNFSKYIDEEILEYIFE